MKRIELQIYDDNGKLGLTLSRMNGERGIGYRIFGPKLNGDAEALKTKELNLSELGRLRKEIGECMRFLKGIE